MSAPRIVLAAALAAALLSGCGQQAAQSVASAPAVAAHSEPAAAKDAAATQGRKQRAAASGPAVAKTNARKASGRAAAGQVKTAAPAKAVKGTAQAAPVPNAACGRPGYECVSDAVLLRQWAYRPWLMPDAKTPAQGVIIRDPQADNELFGASLFMGVDPQQLTQITYVEMLAKGGFDLQAQHQERYEPVPVLPDSEPVTVRGFPGIALVLDESKTPSGTPVRVTMWTEPTDDGGGIAFKAITHRDRYTLAETVTVVEGLNEQ